VADRTRSYEAVAWCYDVLARLYSLNAIARAKAWQVDFVRPGDRVLYVGLGTGEDALLAARRGAVVTGIDLSPRMLRRAEDRFRAEGLTAELIQGDFREHRPKEAYDFVAANFVLDIFGPTGVQRALSHLVALVRPEGLLALADFAPPASGMLRSCLSSVYYRPINLAGWLLGLCVLHPIYDLAADFDSLGIDLLARRAFRVGARGPALYESLIGSKR